MEKTTNKMVFLPGVCIRPKPFALCTTGFSRQWAFPIINFHLLFPTKKAPEWELINAKFL
jgi:hypothetical protein